MAGGGYLALAPQAGVRDLMGDPPLTRPGQPTKNHGKSPLIVDFPMKNGGSIHLK